MNGWSPFTLDGFYDDNIDDYSSNNRNTGERVVIAFVHEEGKETQTFGQYWAANPFFLTKTGEPSKFKVPEHLTEEEVKSLTSKDIETILTDQCVRTRHFPAPPGGPSGATVEVEFKEDVLS